MAIVSLLGVTYGHRGPQEWIAMGINRRCGDSSSTPMTNRGGPGGGLCPEPVAHPEITFRFQPTFACHLFLVEQIDDRRLVDLKVVSGPGPSTPHACHRELEAEGQAKICHRVL